MGGPTTPGRKDWRAYRWAVFDETIVVEGADLAGAALLMQVRGYRDAPGAPLIDLVLAALPAQGLSVTVATVAGLPTSTIRIRINETTIEQLLPFSASGLEPGAEVELVWDMLITPAGQVKSRWFEGLFIIVPGATQA